MSNIDLSIFEALIGFAIILYVIARLLSGWKRLAFGWIAGGIFLVLGYSIVKGMEITSTTVLDADLSVTTILDIGLSSENMFIVLALVGIVMVFSSSGDWI